MKKTPNDFELEGLNLENTYSQSESIESPSNDLNLSFDFKSNPNSTKVNRGPQESGDNSYRVKDVTPKLKTLGNVSRTSDSPSMSNTPK